MASKWGAHFKYSPLKQHVEYTTTYNMDSQTLAIDGSNAENIQSTGGGQAVLNGNFIPSLAADAELDISAAGHIGTGKGATIADGSSRWFLILAESDGTLSVWTAGDAATTGSEVLTVPEFDASIYIPVGLMLIANDSGGTFTVGTTALTGDATFYNLTGPIFPTSTPAASYPMV